MNQRIKEIANKAGLLVHNPEDVPTKLQVFAYLLIEECISKINRTGILEDVEIESDMIADAVAEHFDIVV